MLLLVTLQAFQAMGKGDKQAMAKYNGQQVKQLTRLIEVTRTDLAKVITSSNAACQNGSLFVQQHDVQATAAPPPRGQSCRNPVTVLLFLTG